MPRPYCRPNVFAPLSPTVQSFSPPNRRRKFENVNRLSTVWSPECRTPPPTIAVSPTAVPHVVLYIGSRTASKVNAERSFARAVLTPMLKALVDPGSVSYTHLRAHETPE